MFFTTRTAIMDHLQDKFGISVNDAARAADFAHACGAAWVPGITGRSVHFGEAWGYSVR